MARRPDLDQVATDEEGLYGSEGDLEAAATRIEHQDEVYDGAPAPQEQPMPHLVVIGGNNRGQQHPLGYGDNSIGRGLENDIVVADIAVSRKHTLICAENNQFIVRDLGSGNGTLVNGQKTSSHVLADGDQIEIGKTMLRFRWDALTGAAAQPAATAPPQPAAPAPSYPPAYGDAHGNAHGNAYGQPAAPPAPPAQPQPFRPETAVSETEGNLRPTGLSSRSKKLLIFGGISLVALFGGLFVLKLVLKKPPAQQVVQPKASPDELAAQHWEEGTKQYKARNWEEARKHYLKVLAVAPGFHQAKRYADQSASEISARDALQRAKTAFAAKDFTSARKELSQVLSSSSYAPESRKIKQALDDAQVEQLLESARLLEDSGDRSGALGKVQEALKIAPTNETVRALHARLASDKPGVGKRPRGRRPRVARPSRPARPPKSARPSRPPPSGRPIRVGGDAKTALARYRRKEWGPAYQAAKDAANSQSGRRKASTNSLADAIRRVGQAVLRAQQVQASAPDKAMGYYLTALSNDRKIPGRPHQGWLKGLLQKVVRFQANSAMARGRYIDAYRAISKWRKHGSPDAAMKRVLKDLDGKAKQLFTKAYTIRGSNPKKARRMWQQVLKMVPPSSTAYQKAYSWLNNSAPRYQDEDED